ncbi:hypothetical protein JCM3775_000580 [Rhodotorula graminis]|uniref:Lysophospholipase n=1 Tax=Rhodotorula graminis (strain WP1) TaxID=578459 RepID=A0A0P9EJR1_RHOGW|nr:uncharacterized protein RHOBADRAFT_54434 [Rhodotorula graminis WP1]KPV73839.1 hypothetical protein RHOBADRAFT_54434 [Rhodotorula graminis WP1]
MVRLRLETTRTLPPRRPAPLALAPRRGLASLPTSPPITSTRLFASSVLLAGAGLGAGVGAVAGHAAKPHGSPSSRAFWTLRCDDQPAATKATATGKGGAGRDGDCGDDKDPAWLAKLKSLPRPTLPTPPSLPDFPSLPDLPLPSLRLADVTATLESWKSSLASLSTTFAKLQDELSLGPDSTYAHIVDEGKDARAHPELQWDAQVRLGTDLPISERAFLRNRRQKMRAAFARLVDVPLDDVDERDLPTVSIAASGGGYRAMLNTMASLEAAKETGLWDVVTHISGVSGSCWALNTLYSLGGADISWTLKHLRERVKEPFLQPDTFTGLLNVDDPNSRAILAATILKKASQGGDVSLVDVYGVLVSTRLYVASSALPPPPRPLSLRTMKTSAQRDFIDDGGAPLPIYTTVRHDIPPPSELEKLENENEDKAKEMVQKAEYTWFETTPFEVGSDKLAAWIPTWALGRVFDGGKSAERVPELGVPVLSGIYASAFSASLFSYWSEIRPLLVAMPLFAKIDDFVKSNAYKLDIIHPLPPAELPNFLYNLRTLPSSVPSSLATERTLGFADAGINLNLPYLPLLRRSADVIIALDASADSQDVWFSRAAELARKYDAVPSTAADAQQQQEDGVEQAGRRERSRWPAVDVEALFPAQVAAQQGGKAGDAKDESKEHEKDAHAAAAKVDAAKLQEGASGAKEDGERSGVRVDNPQPAPVGSAPESAERAAHEDGAGAGEDKPMPSSQAREPPLGRCSIWIGSTNPDHAASCRNDHPSVDDVLERNGIALAYIPLAPDDEFKNPLEVFSTWEFAFKEEETDRLIRLAKANFKAGEEQLKTVLKGVWLRKRQQRLADEARGGSADGASEPSSSL